MPLMVCEKDLNSGDLAINRDPVEFPRYVTMLEVHAAIWRQIMENSDEQTEPFKWLLAKGINHEINAPLLLWDSYTKSTRNAVFEQQCDMRRALGALGLSMFIRACISTDGDELALTQLAAAGDSVKLSIDIGPGDDVLVPYVEPAGDCLSDPCVDLARDFGLSPLGDPFDQWYEYSGQECSIIGLYLRRTVDVEQLNRIKVYPYVAAIATATG
jgi:hypothetical protein